MLDVVVARAQPDDIERIVIAVPVVGVDDALVVVRLDLALAPDEAPLEHGDEDLLVGVALLSALGVADDRVDPLARHAKASCDLGLGKALRNQVLDLCGRAWVRLLVLAPGAGFVGLLTDDADPECVSHVRNPRWDFTLCQPQCRVIYIDTGKRRGSNLTPRCTRAPPSTGGEALKDEAAGERFRALIVDAMEARGVPSLAELARRSGVDESDWYGWFRGEHRPRPRTLQAASTYLGIPVEAMRAAWVDEDVSIEDFPEPPDLTRALIAEQRATREMLERVLSSLAPAAPGLRPEDWEEIRSQARQEAERLLRESGGRPPRTPRSTPSPAGHPMRRQSDSA